MRHLQHWRATVLQKKLAATCAWCAAMSPLVQTQVLAVICNSKGAITNAFQQTPPRISPYTTSDFDLLGTLWQLLLIIPVTIIGEWVKGHYQGNNKEFKHCLNEIADDIARDHMADQPQSFTMLTIPTMPPNNKVRLIVNKTVVMSKLPLLISRARHNLT